MKPPEQTSRCDRCYALVAAYDELDHDRWHSTLNTDVRTLQQEVIDLRERINNMLPYQAPLPGVG